LNVFVVGAGGKLAEGDVWCVNVLTYLSWFIIFITLPWSLCVCLKVNYLSVFCYYTFSAFSLFGQGYGNVVS